MQLGTTIRRLGITMVLAIVLSFLLAVVAPDYLLVLYFVILWPALFFSWPYLTRRLRSAFPKSPGPRNPRPISAKPLVLSAVLAIVLSSMLSWIINANVVGISFIPFWVALYYGWPFLSRRLPLLDFEKAPGTPAPKLPL